MKLHSLPKTTTNKKPRRGRGYGSGHGGHTSGRGQKGQKSRSSVRLIFEGGQLPLTKRLPWLRGKSRFQSLKPPTIGINLYKLASLPAKTAITRDTLVKHGLVTAKEATTGHIKILGQGKLDHALIVKDIPASKSAQQKIKQAGGNCLKSTSTPQ